MKIEFDKLLEVNFYHNYYRAEKGEDFEVEPTALCQKELKNYGLLFKKISRGFVVLYELTDDGLGGKEPLRAIDGKVRLSFMLKSRNPYLLNYSDLPLDSKFHHIYCLHNVNDNQQSGDLLLSSATDKNHLSLDDRITLKPQLFQYGFHSENPSAQIEIIDERGDSVISENVSLVEGVLNYPVDLRGRRPGRFTLKIDGQIELVFYASHELTGESVFGIIDIFSNDDVPEAYRFIDGESVAPKKYMVKIKRRQTYWKYCVAFKYYERDEHFKAENLSISHPDPSVKFDSQGVFDGDDVVPVEIFISDKELAFTEEPVKGIDLKLKKSGQGGGHGNVIELKKNLPAPSVNQIVKPDESGSNIYSEIYIYV
ncbi:MAG: hypothetical protein OEV42_07745 [Deltaproteobacteria bacterium]|nr:hypothetical protein [Deltaproteobacteria bacterium]